MKFSEQLKLGEPPVRGDLEGIQYLRGAAALMVVVDHISSMMNEPKYFGRLPFGGLLNAGAVGVDIFFCLSGFIIVYIALSDTLAPKLKIADFFKRRFARIIPFMWLVIIAYAGLRVSARGAFPYADYLRALTLCPVGDVAPPQIWTLRQEALFYIVFATSFLSLRRWPFILWVFSPIAAAFLLPASGAYPGLWRQFASFLFDNVNLLFGLGAVTGIFYVKTGRQWPRGAWAAAFLAAGLLAVFCAKNLIAYNRDSIPEVFFIGILSCLCLIFACMVQASANYLARLCKTLGDASYCIYLTHPIFVSAMLGVFAGHFHQAPDAVIMGITFLIAAGGGVIINKFIEDPLVAWSKSILLPRRAKQTQPA